MANDERINRPVCSFCGKPQEQVRRLVAGPGVFICDECIEPVSYTHLDVYKRQRLACLHAFLEEER